MKAKTISELGLHHKRDQEFHANPDADCEVSGCPNAATQEGYSKSHLGFYLTRYCDDHAFIFIGNQEKEASK